MYKKCQLSKNLGKNGTAYMQSWIRAELARPGVVLDRLEDPETGTIENGWRVEWATEPAQPESLLLKRAHKHRLPSGTAK